MKINSSLVLEIAEDSYIARNMNLDAMPIHLILKLNLLGNKFL